MLLFFFLFFLKKPLTFSSSDRRMASRFSEGDRTNLTEKQHNTIHVPLFSLSSLSYHCVRLWKLSDAGFSHVSVMFFMCVCFPLLHHERSHIHPNGEATSASDPPPHTHKHTRGWDCFSHCASFTLIVSCERCTIWAHVFFCCNIGLEPLCA